MIKLTGRVTFDMEDEGDDELRCLGDTAPPGFVTREKGDDSVIFVRKVPPPVGFVEIDMQLHPVSRILGHRVCHDDGRLVSFGEIESGDVGFFEYETQFKWSETVHWLKESAFADTGGYGEYCSMFVDYCDKWGIIYA